MDRDPPAGVARQKNTTTTLVSLLPPTRHPSQLPLWRAAGSCLFHCSRPLSTTVAPTTLPDPPLPTEPVERTSRPGAERSVCAEAAAPTQNKTLHCVVWQLARRLRSRRPTTEHASTTPRSRGPLRMLGGWVNPHREQQTIPQGQLSIPPKSFSTPTANGQSAPR